MEYKTPWLAILGLVVALIWALDFWKVFVRNVLVVGALKERKQVVPSVLRIIIFVLGVWSWGNISYSLLQPRTSRSFAPSSREVNDIFLVVDVSRSMLAEDLQPNRLEVAKEKLREFAKLRPTDRIGLIIFSEKVFTLLPLSTDPELLDRVIADINIGYLGSGTNIGDGLALAVARAQDSETKNKVIVLLTDGVNNVGNIAPLQAAEEAKKNNIKVYTIGLGTDNGEAKLPVGKSIFGTQYQNIPGGSIDYKTLKQIASMTGGKFYSANTDRALESVLSDIQKLEKTEIKIDNQVVYDEHYYDFFIKGFLGILLVELMRRLFLREAL